MPNIGELIGKVVRLILDTLGASEMRLGPVPTLAVLLVPLVVLSLTARPNRRVAARDLGALDRIGPVMAGVAESGGDAVVSLGSAGLVRATSAAERIQTLAAISLLDRVARAAARAAVPLRVTVNDPIVAYFTQGVIERAHAGTATSERAVRSVVVFEGEGRPLAAASALADARRHGMSMTTGGLGEEGLLLIGGAAAPAGWSVGGSASPSELAAPLLESNGALIGPELFQAAGAAKSDGATRASAQAADRLILLAIVAIAAGSAVVVLGAQDVATFLAGR